MIIVATRQKGGRSGKFFLLLKEVGRLRAMGFIGLVRVYYLVSDSWNSVLDIREVLRKVVHGDLI